MKSKRFPPKLGRAKAEKFRGVLVFLVVFIFGFVAVAQVNAEEGFFSKLVNKVKEKTKGIGAKKAKSTEEEKKEAAPVRGGGGGGGGVYTPARLPQVPNIPRPVQIPQIPRTPLTLTPVTAPVTRPPQIPTRIEVPPRPVAVQTSPPATPGVAVTQAPETSKLQAEKEELEKKKKEKRIKKDKEE